MFPDFGISKVHTEEDFLWVMEEEHETIKTVQMIEKRRPRYTDKQKHPNKIRKKLSSDWEQGSFNKNSKILVNPDVWITYSAASNHTTPHFEGMMKIKKVTTETAWGMS